MGTANIRRWLVLLICVAALIAGSSVVRADEVDSLIQRLTSSSDYKERLNAALNLAKTGDPRAVGAFVRALRDSDKTVRGVAAASLGKLVTTATPSSQRSAALEALARVATNDPNDFVRKQAKKSHDAIDALGEAAPVAGGVYVNIGPMSDKASAGASLLGSMRTTVTKSFAKAAPRMVTEWPSERAPTAKQLATRKMTGFHVDGTLTALTIEKARGTATVSCKVSMLIASYPDKSLFGFLEGGAKVQSGASEREIGFAAQDCVVAVVEDLVVRKIIPAIAQRAH